MSKNTEEGETYLKKIRSCAIIIQTESALQCVFAGDNIVTGAATVIAAMGAGKKTTRQMKEYCLGKYGK